MSDNFVHLLILLGVAGGAIPSRQAPNQDARPAPAAVTAASHSTTAAGVAPLRNTAARPDQETMIQTKKR